MESNYSFDITNIAALDVFDVEEYIKNTLQNNDASISLSNEIKEKIKEVCNFPMLNHNCKYYGIDDECYRYIKVKNYNFFYYVNKNDKRITFIRFLYSTSNIEASTIIAGNNNGN